jgi:hypothetical protein
MTSFAITVAIFLAFFALKSVRPDILMRLPSPRNWWQAGLMYGTAMFAWYVIKHAIRGDATLMLVGREFLIWEFAGVVFGILLTAAMSVLFQKNFFHGFPNKRGNR